MGSVGGLQNQFWVFVGPKTFGDRNYIIFGQKKTILKNDERRLFGAYAVTRLSHYVREHFTVEEALMKSVGYPGLADHLAEHAVFRAKLRELQTESVGHDISHDAVKFLSDWLCDHIARVDMAYVPYLKR